jgi:hypothetical protein
MNNVFMRTRQFKNNPLWLIPALVLLCGNFTLAQGLHHPGGWLFTIGPGVLTTPHNNLYMASGVELTIVRNHLLLSSRWLGGIHAEYESTGPSTWAKDLGLLLGGYLPTRMANLSFSAGVGRAYGKHERIWHEAQGSQPSYYQIRHFQDLALIAELQIMCFDKGSGWGLYLFKDINSYSSFQGALLCLQLGRYR